MLIHRSLGITAVLGLAFGVWAGEEPVKPVIPEKPDPLPYKTLGEILREAQEKTSGAETRTQQAVETQTQQWKKEQAEASKPRESSIKVDGQSAEVKYNNPQTVQELLDQVKAACGTSDQTVTYQGLPTYRPSEKEFEILSHDLWQLDPSDFVHRPLFDMVLRSPVTGEQVYTVMPFRLKNSTAKARPITLRISIVTDKGRIVPEVSSFTVAQTWELQPGLPRGNPVNVWEHRSGAMRMQTPPPDASPSGEDLDAKAKTYLEKEDAKIRARRHGTPFELPTSDLHAARAWETVSEMIVNFAPTPDAEAVFQPGEERYGVAVFPRVDLEAKEFKIVIEGLNNTFAYGRGIKKPLVIEYERLGDEFNRYQDSLKMLRKDWQELWQWETSIEFGAPQRKALPRPNSGLGERELYCFPVSVYNRTGKEQPFVLESVSPLFDIDATRLTGLTVEGVAEQQFQQADGKITAKGERKTYDLIKDIQEEAGENRRVLLTQVPVRLVDDGQSSIYKARVMQEDASIGFKKDRFERETRGATLKIAENENVYRTWCIVDLDADVDWPNFFTDLERRLATVWGNRIIRAAGESGVSGGSGGREVVKPLATPRLVVELTAAQRAEVRRQVREQIAQGFQRAMNPERPIDKRIDAMVRIKSGLASGENHVVSFFFAPGEIRVKASPPAGFTLSKDGYRLLPAE